MSTKEDNKKTEKQDNKKTEKQDNKKSETSAKEDKKPETSAKEDNKKSEISSKKKKDQKIDEEIKYCPNCQVPTIKTKGCNKIRCVCKIKWCWQCGQRKARKDKPIDAQNNVCANVKHKSG